MVSHQHPLQHLAPVQVEQKPTLTRLTQNSVLVFSNLSDPLIQVIVETRPKPANPQQNQLRCLSASSRSSRRARGSKSEYEDVTNCCSEQHPGTILQCYRCAQTSKPWGRAIPCLSFRHREVAVKDQPTRSSPPAAATITIPGFCYSTGSKDSECTVMLRCLQ